MNSTTIAPSASNTSGANVVLVTVRMRSLDPRLTGASRVLSSVSFVIEPLHQMELSDGVCVFIGLGAKQVNANSPSLRIADCKPECLLRCLLTGNFFNAVFSLMPTGIGVVFFHRFGESLC